MKKLVLIITASLLLMTATQAQSPFYGGGNRGGYGNFAGAIVGGIIGGVISGAFSPRYQPYYQPQVDAYTYCTSRFRSWNPETGYYLGYDGQYRRCP